uniref:Uncharacterized protein n=1 Tax=Periophthalmus magnuspinnatus TaxID=409849 RepID=A0A3B4BGA5_9GOBI
MRVCYHWLLLLLHWHKCVTGTVTSLRAISPYIKHYEGLSYDREDLHKRHLRARRSTLPQDTFLHLDFVAFQRPFRLRLRRDAAIFSQDFTVINKNGSTLADLSHLYSGILEGEDDSSCHGSVIQGQFEGTIHTSNGTYHVESMERYHNTADHHSVIYHEDDLGKTNYHYSGCITILPNPTSNYCIGVNSLVIHSGIFFLHPFIHYGYPLKMISSFNTSCLLHFHADHLYFNRFKSVEVVVAQVMTEEDAKNPLQRLYIGPEKLLSIYSENNWGNYCLSYLLTNRDYSGVLGLAWEGKNGKEKTLHNYHVLILAYDYGMDYDSMNLTCLTIHICRLLHDYYICPV